MMMDISDSKFKMMTRLSHLSEGLVKALEKCNSLGPVPELKESHQYASQLKEELSRLPQSQLFTMSCRIEDMLYKLIKNEHSGENDFFDYIVLSAHSIDEQIKLLSKTLMCKFRNSIILGENKPKIENTSSSKDGVLHFKGVQSEVKNFDDRFVNELDNFSNVTYAKEGHKQLLYLGRPSKEDQLKKSVHEMVSEKNQNFDPMIKPGHPLEKLHMKLEEFCQSYVSSKSSPFHSSLIVSLDNLSDSYKKYGIEVQMIQEIMEAELPAVISDKLTEYIELYISLLLDYGYETKIEREALKKPSFRTIKITTVSSDLFVKVKIEDDGNGKKYLAKAIESEDVRYEKMVVLEEDLGIKPKEDAFLGRGRTTKFTLHMRQGIFPAFRVKVGSNDYFIPECQVLGFQRLGPDTMVNNNVFFKHKAVPLAYVPGLATEGSIDQCIGVLFKQKDQEYFLPVDMAYGLFHISLHNIKKHSPFSNFGFVRTGENNYTTVLDVWELKPEEDFLKWVG